METKFKVLNLLSSMSIIDGRIFQGRTNTFPTFRDNEVKEKHIFGETL